MMYNDRSVQENHHISAAFGLLNTVSAKVFDTLLKICLLCFCNSLIKSKIVC